MTGRDRLQALLDDGVAAGVFPCAAAVVLQDGRRVLAMAAGAATLETAFDLASLTKPLATTAAFLTLWRDGIVGPDTPAADLSTVAAVGRTGTTLADLLTHRAGLPGFAPLFVPVLREMPALLAPGCPAELRAAARAEAVSRALAVVPEAPRRTRALYSDVGFIVLGELLAAAAGMPLDALFVDRIAAPLGVGVRFHRLSAGPGARASLIAPTGRTRPREPAPGQEGLWEPFPPHPSPAGEVDDDNAWVMDGVAGHAGLFGTAADLAAVGQAILDDWGGAGRLAPPSYWERALSRDAETPGSTRALGFDTRRPGDPRGAGSAGRRLFLMAAARLGLFVGPRGAGSAGHRLGDRPPGAVGHTGYTGTSLWIDLGRRLVVALCTNRTAGPLGRADVRIYDFRPRFHDALVETLDPA